MSSDARRYLFVVSSSYGHLFPAIRMAHALQRRGQDVLFVTARENQILLDMQGIRCVAFPRQPHPFLSTHDWYNAGANVGQYESVKGVFEAYRPQMIVTTPLVLPAFALAEASSTPIVVIGYSEHLFPGPDDVASPKRWRLDDFTRYYNQLRAALDLAPIAADPSRSPLIGDHLLLRSIPQFNTHSGLPRQVRFVGPLLWEPEYRNHELARYIDGSSGSPAFYVQIGRLFEDWPLWRRLVDLLGTVDARFLVDIGRSDYLGEVESFPDNFYLHPFVPLAAVAEHVQGVICSGQTISAMSALSHGKPILAVPSSADGREVAERISHHGVGWGVHNLHEVGASTVRDFMSAAASGTFDAQVATFRTAMRVYDDDDRILGGLAP